MNVFITGATGYIGSYVAASLLDNYNIHLNVLVRAQSIEEARQRLWRAWQIHFGWDQFSQLLDRCHIYLGDMTDPQLGLDNDNYMRLVASTSSIIHCAASLNRKSEKSCLNVNLRGTLAIIKVARAIHNKTGLRRFSMVSTVAVAGTREHENVFEDEAIDWKRSDYDPYARTKKFSEHMLRELLPDISTIIFRPSVVLGDSRIPQTTQFDMARAFAFFAKLPLLPLAASSRIDIVPVNYAARAIVSIHQKESPKHDTYNLSSGMASLTYRDILNKLYAAGYEKRNYFLPWLQKPFTMLVNRLANLRQIPTIAQPASLLKVFLPYILYDTVFINDRIVEELGEAPAPFSEYAYSLLQFLQSSRFNYPYLPYPTT